MEQSTCKYCKSIPDYIQFCNGGGETYYAMICKCKITPYRGSLDCTIREWEQKYFEMHPNQSIKETYKNSSWPNANVPIWIVDDALIDIYPVTARINKAKHSFWRWLSYMFK